MVRGYVSEKHFIFQSTYSSQINERTVLYKQQCTHLLLISFIYNLIFFINFTVFSILPCRKIKKFTNRIY